MATAAQDHAEEIEQSPQKEPPHALEPVGVLGQPGDGLARCHGLAPEQEP